MSRHIFWEKEDPAIEGERRHENHSMRKSDPGYDFTEEYSEKRAAESLETYGLRRRTDVILEILQALEEDTVVLDLGTADGLMISMLRKKLNNMTFIGLDLDLRLVKVARKCRLDVINANIYGLCIRDSSIDVALLCSTFKHLSNPDGALSEFHRILKPDGLLIITDPRPMVVRVGSLMGYFDKRYSKNVWSVKSVTRQVERCGFTKIEEKYFMPLRQLKRLWPIFALVNKVLDSSFGLSSQLIMCRKVSEFG